MYAQLGSFARVARKVGVATRTLQYWFHAAGIRGVRRKPHKRKNLVDSWIAAHPDVPLPPSAAKIAKLTGISSDVVWSHFVRRAVKVRAYVEALGDLCERTEVLRAKSPDGTRDLLVPPKAIKSYRVVVDKWSLTVRYDGVLRVGVPFCITLPYAQVKDFWKKESSHGAS